MRWRRRRREVVPLTQDCDLPGHKLIIDPHLLIVPGGTKRDERRLRERIEQAEREGWVTITCFASAANAGAPGTSAKAAARSKAMFRRCPHVTT